MKLLTIHSFAVHGTASLKAFISLLGTRVLPVPSLYLTGLTNLPGIRKTEVDFENLLVGSLELARLRGQRLVVYVGYLGHPDQALLIEAQLRQYRDLIEAIVVDPVSGDHGRTYVPADVVASWPRLLHLADWSLPNYTELQLHSGLPLEAHEPAAYLAAFQARYPRLNFVATSLPAQGQLGLHLQAGTQQQRYTHERLPRNYGGSGDVFAAFFLKYLYFERRSPYEALQQATQQTLAIMRQTLEEESPDLLLELG